MTYYYCSWSSNFVGEACYTRCFNSEEERKAFISRIACKRVTVRTWECTI